MWNYVNGVFHGENIAYCAKPLNHISVLYIKKFDVLIHYLFTRIYRITQILMSSKLANLQLISTQKPVDHNKNTYII